MTQQEKVLWLLRRGPCTAADFLFTTFDDGKTVANEWRARVSELRPKLKLAGENIYYHRKAKVYTLAPWPPLNGEFPF